VYASEEDFRDASSENKSSGPASDLDDGLRRSSSPPKRSAPHPASPIAALTPLFTRTCIPSARDPISPAHDGVPWPDFNSVGSSAPTQAPWLVPVRSSRRMQWWTWLMPVMCQDARSSWFRVRCRPFDVMTCRPLRSVISKANAVVSGSNPGTCLC